MTSDTVRVDWRHEEEFAALDPAAVKTPVLLINGERDPYANAAALPVFFSKLAGWIGRGGAGARGSRGAPGASDGVRERAGVVHGARGGGAVR